jgi:uncharacterized membrane protein YfcA
MFNLETLMLLVVGVGGGTLSSLLGGAALIVFPALLAIGLDPVAAVIVNTVALAPVSLAAAYLERSQLPLADRAIWNLMAASVAGALLGAMLLLATPARMFELLIPLLLGGATVLFACSRQVATFIEGKSRSAAGGGRWGHTARALVGVGFYAGYFGAGVGVLLLGVLSVGTKGDYRIANAIKNLLTGANIAMATTIYAWNGAVAWRPAIVMSIGGLAGAWIGIRIARVAPREVMKIAVVAMGAILTAVYALRYWAHLL